MAPQWDRRFRESLSERSTAEILEASTHVRNTVQSKGFQVMMEFAGLVLDRRWRNAADAEHFRYFQGMAQMLYFLPRLSEMLEIEAKARLAQDEARRKQATGVEKNSRIMDLGEKEVEMGLSAFKNTGGGNGQ